MDATELVFLMVKSITLKQVTNGFFPLTYKRCSKTKKIYQEISFFQITTENNDYLTLEGSSDSNL